MLIIGHAYGSHHGSAERNHAGIAPSVESLIQQNKQNIKTIIFTGDVFSVPSEKKWEALRRLTQPIPVYVAPGNHDVEITSDNAFRDIFRQRQSNQSKTYPQSFINGNTLFILDDSTLGDSSERLLHFILNEVEEIHYLANLSWQDIIFLQEVLNGRKTDYHPRAIGQPMNSNRSGRSSIKTLTSSLYMATVAHLQNYQEWLVNLFLEY